MASRQASPVNAKSHRHWVRFSLRTMLLLTTVIAVWFGTVGRSARIQKTVVELVREVGGEVHYAFQYDHNGNLQVNAEHWAPKWLRDSIGDDYFMTVVDVVLPSTRDAGKYYDVDATLEHLVPLKGLQGLTIKAQQLTDNGLEIVSRFTHLVRLNISSTWVTDMGIAHIGKMTQLKSLFVAVPRMSDAGIELLSQNKELESLKIYGGSFTGDGFAHLVSLSDLRSLSLHGRHGEGEKVTDGVLKHICQLTKLENLSLSNIIITEFGLGHLKKMTNLKSASLPMRSISIEEAKNLQRALPKAQLARGNGFGNQVRVPSP